MKMGAIDYCELPVRSVAAQTGFYQAVFGWGFTNYEPDYAACEEGPCQLGLNGRGEHRRTSILPVIRAGNIKEARVAVRAAGGTVTRDVFDFLGGRRFHFADPEGLELAAYQPISQGS